MVDEMKHIIIATAILASIAIGCSISDAQADTVMMTNGDRISGRINYMREGQLRLSNEYTESVVIEWSKVVSFYTEEPVVVRMKNHDTETLNRYQSFDSTERDEDEIIEIFRGAAVKDNHLVMTGKISGAIKVERGITRQNDVDLDFLCQWKSVKERIRFFAEYEFDDDQNVVNASQWHLIAQYDRPVGNRSHYGSRVSLKHDKLADMYHRVTGGGYVGHTFSANTDRALAGDLGLEYVLMNRSDPGPDHDYLATSWSLNAEYEVLPSLLKVYHRQHGLASTENLSHLLIDAWTGLRIVLRDGYFANPEIKVEYDSESPAGIASWAYTYRLKFGYEW